MSLSLGMLPFSLFFKIHINIILPSNSSSSKWFLISRLLMKTVQAILFYPLVLHTLITTPDFIMLIISARGHAGSIPDGVIGIFH